MTKALSIAYQNCFDSLLLDSMCVALVDLRLTPWYKGGHQEPSSHHTSSHLQHINNRQQQSQLSTTQVHIKWPSKVLCY